MSNSDRFLLSDSALEVASRLGLWDPSSGAPFDFAACYSAGEARHLHYSGRRHWRALSLLAPSLGLSPYYEDLLLGAPTYPFSVVPDRPIDRTDFFAIMRDTYTGTKFDLAAQPAAGPFSMTDRYDGGLASSALDGHFERPIGVYRMAYSYVGEATRGRPVVFWGPHAAQTGMYFPITLTSIGGCVHVPPALSTGSIKKIDRGCAYWAFRRVKQSAMICWDRSLEHIVARQVRNPFQPNFFMPNDVLSRQYKLSEPVLGLDYSVRGRRKGSRLSTPMRQAAPRRLRSSWRSLRRLRWLTGGCLTTS